MSNLTLLSRDDFREGVFSRDKYQCVLCGKAGVDAHHIIERKLWQDGGYYLDNGATLCEACHLKAEYTLVSCEEIRVKAGIDNLLLPVHLQDTRQDYFDKWGNPLYGEHLRLQGELFFEEAVQIALSRGKKLSLFLAQILPPQLFTFEEGYSSFDDETPIIVLPYEWNQRAMVNQNICISPTTDVFPQKSLDKIRAIPQGWKVEVVWLEKEMAVLGFWNEDNDCLNWDETLEWAELIELPLLKPIFKGIYATFVSQFQQSNSAYYIRNKQSFSLKFFKAHVATQNKIL